MNTVDPIKTKGEMKKMRKYLKKNNMRNYALFILGTNSALRASDLLSFLVSTIQNLDGSIKDRVTVKEKKTGKTKIFPINDLVKETIIEYLSKSNLDFDDYLFPSRQGENQPITRQTVNNILKEAANACGIKENIASHSMRKSFGYWAYKSGVDIMTVMKLLNHSSPAITLRYLGITQENLDEVYMNMSKIM